jgi:hypothetical protein
VRKGAWSDIQEKEWKDDSRKQVRFFFIVVAIVTIPVHLILYSRVGSNVAD